MQSNFSEVSLRYMLNIDIGGFALCVEKTTVMLLSNCWDI